MKTGRPASVLVDGVPLVDLCRERGLVVSTVKRRLKRGWSVEDAINGRRAGNGNTAISGRVEDLTGKIFSRLTVIDYAGTKGGSTMWRCVCSCGKEIVTRSSHLKSGKSKSCGCYHLSNFKEGRGTPRRTHGMSRSKLYNVYRAMKSRCYLPSTERYKSYGGRGIKICESWLENPESFLQWSIDNGYRDGLQIDRIDVNGDYSPENCRWITAKDNARNKQNTLRMASGVSLADFAEKNNLDYHRCVHKFRSGITDDAQMIKAIRGVS